MSDAPPDEVGAAFDRARARAALVIAPLVFLILWFAPLPLPDQAHRLAAVMGLVVTLWIGEPIPLAVTALLAPALALLVGAVPGAEVDARKAVTAAFSGFGDPILMLFIGGFFIAEAMTVHALDRRLAMTILSLRALGSSPRNMVIGLGLTCCVLSMWVSNTATTALLIPIAAGMLRVASPDEDAPEARRLASTCMLMLPFAATVGGLGTPVGTAPNLVGLAQIQKLTGERIEFLRWMALALPLVLAMMLALATLLTRGLPRLGADLRAHALAERVKLGPWRRGEVVTAMSFGLAVSLWIASGLAQLDKNGPLARWFESHLPEGAIALLASSLLFIVKSAPERPTLTWREATRIDWGTLLLLGSGLSLGALMGETGLARAIGGGVVQWLKIDSLWTLTAVAAFMAIGLSELTSNTATATILVPVVIQIAKEAGVSPLPPALAATFGCSFGFMLPVSTPPNALAYATGKVPISLMARRGFVFDLIGAVIIVVGLRLLWPVFGL